MQKMFRTLCLLSLGICIPLGPIYAEEAPPNWKVFAAGTTDGPGDGTAPDVDVFAGKSTHLGRFQGEGAHLINPVDLSFIGYATYTGANGDQIDVAYTGQVVGIDPDTEFPISVIGDFEITGGTGRFENATGNATMTGAFTGVPGDFYFELNGTLHPQGK